MTSTTGHSSSGQRCSAWRREPPATQLQLRRGDLPGLGGFVFDLSGPPAEVGVLEGGSLAGNDSSSSSSSLSSAFDCGLLGGDFRGSFMPNAPGRGARPHIGRRSRRPSRLGGGESYIGQKDRPRRGPVKRPRTAPRSTISASARFCAHVRVREPGGEARRDRRWRRSDSSVLSMTLPPSRDRQREAAFRGISDVFIFSKRPTPKRRRRLTREDDADPRVYCCAARS